MSYIPHGRISARSCCFRLFLHLSENGSAADAGELPAYFRAGKKTNEAYALAKISGLKYCEFLNRQYGTDYISAMPTNLYGPNDNYHPTHSHVLPALIRRFHEAKVSGATEVTCWEPARRCASSYMWMILRMPAYF